MNTDNKKCTNTCPDSSGVTATHGEHMQSRVALVLAQSSRQPQLVTREVEADRAVYRLSDSVSGQHQLHGPLKQAPVPMRDSTGCARPALGRRCHQPREEE